jgi:hypothetical protein
VLRTMRNVEGGQARSSKKVDAHELITRTRVTEFEGRSYISMSSYGCDETPAAVGPSFRSSLFNLFHSSSPTLDAWMTMKFRTSP